ncbi:hypothetical protein J4G08_13765 [Candidatus Poribacteria bacterium]|nr:hypothetical protein [Candidatus Poribacteria bacterium]
MQEKLILEKISHVRRRLNVQGYFQTLATFLFFGLLVCVPVVIVDSVVTSFNIPPLVFLLVACGVAVITLIVRLIRPVNLHEAARAIDIDASLKDRVVSGLEQIQRNTNETLTALQLQDTSKRLQAIPIKQVARYTVPRETKFIAIVAIFLITFSFIEFFAPPATSTEIDFSPQIAAEADSLLKKIEEAKKEAEQDEDQELKEILKEIEERTLELKKPQIAPKDALARMTELTALLKTKTDPLKMAQQEELMKGLGQQFIGNPILGDFGQQLKRGDYKEAADKLDKVAADVPKYDQEKRQNLSDELKRAGKSLKDTDLDGLGSGLSGAGESLEGNDGEGAQKGLRASGKKIRDFDLLLNRNKRLAKLLSECEACKAGIAGACNAKGINSATGLTNLLSNKPGEGVGNKTSKTQLGEQTSLDSTLNLEQLKGVQGEGSSTVQTSKASAEGQESGLSYKDAYMKYQKLSEDALTEEQIPLGYKFYVKRYFESIKPTDE